MCYNYKYLLLSIQVIFQAKHVCRLKRKPRRRYIFHCEEVITNTVLIGQIPALILHLFLVEAIFQAKTGIDSGIEIVFGEVTERGGVKIEIRQC